MSNTPDIPPPEDDRIIADAFKRSFLALSLLGALAAAAVWWFSRPVTATHIRQTDVTAPQARKAPDGTLVPSIRFTDQTAAAGIRFRHENGAYGRKLLPETMGAGWHFSMSTRMGIRICCSSIPDRGQTPRV